VATGPVVLAGCGWNGKAAVVSLAGVMENNRWLVQMAGALAASIHDGCGCAWW
jgi:hypothetical protein